jgi:hypothetical protein
MVRYAPKIEDESKGSHLQHWIVSMGRGGRHRGGTEGSGGEQTERRTCLTLNLDVWNTLDCIGEAVLGYDQALWIAAFCWKTEEPLVELSLIIYRTSSSYSHLASTYSILPSSSFSLTISRQGAWLVLEGGSQSVTNQRQAPN